MVISEIDHQKISLPENKRPKIKKKNENTQVHKIRHLSRNKEIENSGQISTDLFNYTDIK